MPVSVGQRSPATLGYDGGFVRALLLRVQRPAHRPVEQGEPWRREPAAGASAARRTLGRRLDVRHRTHDIEGTTLTATELVHGHGAANPPQLVFAAVPRSPTLGPSLVGRMSKSNMPVGRYSEQHAFGMSTTPDTRPSIGADPSSR
jgi:hypothetical protein